MKSYQLSAPANRDVVDILSYLTDKNPSAAQRFAHQLFKEFRHLADWPGSGRLRPEFTRTSLRFWPIGDYLIIYLAEIEPLTIVRILHTSRDITAILNRHLVSASND